MKSYTLHKHPLRLERVCQDKSNKIVNQPLYDSIISKKSSIDKVQRKWDNAKKASNDYEYIYTSSNSRRNISDVVPVSRSFFKLREIIYDYRIKSIETCACIAEAPGGFIQSLLQHSEERNLQLTNIYGITLISDDKDIPYWNPNLLKHPKVTVSEGCDGTGDIYKLHNILNYIHLCGKSSCDIVTADGGFDYTSNFEQELSSYKLFYSEIFIALNVQKKGGLFVCKLFDLFYYSTIQLVYILYLSYEHVTFVKPSTSRKSNSEKYIVCRGFRGYNQEISNLMCRNMGRELLPISVPREFIDDLNKYHTLFINHQIQRINSTLELIRNKKMYDKPTKNQVTCALEWCRMYNVTINKNCVYLKY